MKIVVPALAVAFVATIGATSAAQAAVTKLDFGVNVSGGTGITYTGANLRVSTALNLDASDLTVSFVGAGDMSGLAVGDPVSLVPTDIVYSTISSASPVIKSWTDSLGKFTETLTSVESLDRSTRNEIGLTLDGTLTGPGFAGTPVTFILTANQAGGPGNVVTASITDSGSTVPEPSTWVMMVLGFAALGYAAVRQSAKDRSALAI
jgi:hypothetical protein